MPRIFRYIAKRMMILFLLLGGMGLVCQEAQAAPAARAMWDENTKTLTFYYGEQKSGGTTHYSGTEITATGTTPAWLTSAVRDNITKVVFESSFASVRPTECTNWFGNMTKLTTITGINYLNATNVTSMYAMFHGCSGLTSLNLSSFNTDNVTNMQNMFNGCSGLTSLNLSSFNTANVTNMNFMFYDCSGLTSLNLSSFNTANVTHMWGMFINCCSLTSLDLCSFNTAKVTNMQNMFTGCSNLQIIYVDESKWSTAAIILGGTMFAGCSKLVGGNGTTYNSSYTDQTRACIDKPGQAGYLTCATVYGTCGASGSSIIWYIDCDGVLNIKGTGAMADYTAASQQPWASHRDNITSIVVGSGITHIGAFAFHSLSNLSSITIPNSVTSIGNYAFRYCYALTSIALPNPLTSIGTGAFRNCTGLTSITIPSSVTAMGKYVLTGTTNLKDIYLKWTGTNILALPNNFSATDKTVHIPCGTISDYTNKGWSAYTLAEEIANGTCGTNVTWTLSCDGILTISGTGAMSNYPGLNMPWKSHRASITSVVISDGVTSIGYNAFNGCSNLTSVTIPPSVTSIEQNAFYGCYAMESLYITDLAAWCNVEFGVSVEATPFMRNNYNSGSTEYLGGGNLYLNGTLVTTLTIPDGITEIKNLTFLGCSSITSIDFNQVTTIGSASFKGCHGLTSVTLPEGVTSLQNAFPYCTQLQSISIPSSLTSLAYQTLYHSDALTDIYVYWTDNIPGWPEYFTAKSPQPSITLHVPCGTEELYNTTANWKKYHIEGEYTASGTCGAEGDNLTWELCDSTLSIFGTGEMMNYYFGSLDKVPWYSYREAVKSVIVTSGVTNIGDYAFYRCSSLTSVTLPTGLVAIGNDAFHYCSELSSIIIPDNVTSIGDYAFSVCSSLTSVTLPSGLVTIGNGAFSYCSELSSIIIPDNVTSIGNYAFYRCSKISSVTFPNGLISIGQFAFGENESLSSITIPRSVTDVGWRAFGYWDNKYHPNDITVEWTENIPFIIEVTNSSPQSDITLHVPCEAIELYKAADGWKDYTIEGEGGPYTVTVQAEDPTMGDVSITVNP